LSVYEHEGLNKASSLGKINCEVFAGLGTGRAAGLGAGLPIPARAASISSMTSHSRSSVWSVAGAGVVDSASDGEVVGSASNGGVVGSASDAEIVGLASDGEIVGFASDGEIVGVASDGEIVGVFRRQWGGWVVVSFLEARSARRKRSCSWRAASSAARAKTA
jgi:hypothetical protein